MRKEDTRLPLRTPALPLIQYLSPSLRVSAQANSESRESRNCHCYLTSTTVFVAPAGHRQIARISLVTRDTRTSPGISIVRVAPAKRLDQSLTCDSVNFSVHHLCHGPCDSYLVGHSVPRVLRTSFAPRFKYSRPFDALFSRSQSWLSQSPRFLKRPRSLSITQSGKNDPLLRNANEGSLTPCLAKIPCLS